MSVRLEQLLANATPGPWEISNSEVLGIRRKGNFGGDTDPVEVVGAEDDGQAWSDADLIALAPDMARLLIDMGDALWRGKPAREVDALLARLDALGKDTA